MGAKSRRKKPEVKENNRKRIEKIQESKKKRRKTTSGGDFHDDDGKNKNGTTKNNNNNRNTNGGGGAFAAGIIEAVPILASYVTMLLESLFVAMAYCKELKMVLLVDDRSKKSLVVSVFEPVWEKEKKNLKRKTRYERWRFRDAAITLPFPGTIRECASLKERREKTKREEIFITRTRNTRLANKKVTSVTFTLDSKHIVYSDKYGDVRVSEVLSPVNESNKDITTTTTTKDEKIDAEGGDAETGVFDKLLLGHTGRW